ncbi:MAG: UDP-N-acetylmuramoyl-tripeptide--D-alanyl-D-alanine ligase [Oscillospiraceae bacterium]|nr:UDP-N-acetylmuramoyl-tripeptide--D-alanyl-D-alanine ligase [Oscillospiraceae bacterium]
MGAIILYVVFGVFTLLITVRFMHMFQLASYQFPGYRRWMKSEGWRFPVNYIPLYPHGKAKTPLKHTSRVIRIELTHGLLLFVIMVSAWFTGGLAQYIILAAMFIGAPFLLPLANLLLSPVQKAVNDWYIRDAQRMMRKDLIVVGVTGSYGKTSVKTYIAQLLSVKYNVLATPASYNTPMGVVRAIRENLLPSHQVFVCEMGARHTGNIKELCGIARPLHGVLTAIGPQHLETFKTIENIAKTKFELIDSLPPEGTAFLCWNNPVIREHAKDRRAVRYAVLDAGIGTDGLDIYAENLAADAGGVSFDIVTGAGERERFTCGLLGRHNVQNVTAAAAVALHLGVPLRDMVPVVRALKPARHRLELLPKGQGLTVIDDAYNANPAGAAAALEALSLFGGVKIIVTPGMVELGALEEAENRALGEKIAKVCDYAALVGEKQALPIAEGLRAAGYPAERMGIFDSFDNAYQWAAGIEAEEKVILLENDLPDNYR